MTSPVSNIYPLRYVQAEMPIISTDWSAREELVPIVQDSDGKNSPDGPKSSATAITFNGDAVDVRIDALPYQIFLQHLSHCMKNKEVLDISDGKKISGIIKSYSDVPPRIQ